MSFEILWSDTAIKQLKKLDRSVAKRVFRAVSQFKERPFRHIIKIVNSDYYRLRVGDYRVILDLQKRAFRILIVKVGHRSRIYK